MESVVLCAAVGSGDEWSLPALSAAFDQVVTVRSLDKLHRLLENKPVAVAVVAYRPGGRDDSLAAVETVREHAPTVPVVFRSPGSDGDLAAAATRAGATEYYPADTADESLVERVRTHLAAAGDGSATAMAANGAGSAGAPDPVAGDGAGPQSQPGGSQGDGETVAHRGKPAAQGSETTGAETAVEAGRYEQILEAVDDGVYAVDEDARLVYVNGAMERLTGYDRSELLGEHVEIIAGEETLTAAAQVVEDLVAGEATRPTVEFDLEPKEGERFHCEDHLTVLTDDDGTFRGTAGIIRDVTERERRGRRLSNLLETSQSLLEARTRAEVGEIVARAAQDALGQDFSVVRLVDDDGEVLEPVARAGGAVQDRPSYPVGEGGPGTAFAAGEIRRLRRDDVPDPVGDVGYVEDVLYVPLDEWGVLSIVTADPEGFDENDVSMAEVLASTAAVALDRAAREEELLRYRTVIENVQDMVYVLDADGRFTLVTEPLASYLGYDREELVGAHPEIVMVDADVPTFESVIGELWHDPDVDSRRLETELVTADGERRPTEVEVSLFPTDDSFAGTVGVVRDVSELVETRQLLADQRDRFTYLFDNLPDAVVEATLDGSGGPVVRQVNEAFTDVFGYSAESVVGESLNDFVLPEDARAEGERLDRQAAEGEITNVEVRRRTADGYRDFLLRGIPYEQSDEGTHSFGIYTDITAQKERERRLEVLNRVLRHNLRNDVNVMVGYAEVLAENVDDDDLAVRAGALREKAADLAALSDRARSLDRTMRQGSARDSRVALDDLVADTVEGFLADEPSLTVETDVAPVEVVGDERLGIAVRELLDNAVEHAGESPTVRFETERTGREVRLRVTDDGPGIPRSERGIVSGDVEITQLTHGSGLGLWIVKWVCASCGGRLDFETDDDGRTSVVLSLAPVEDA